MIHIREAARDDRDAIVAIVPRLRAFGEHPLYTPDQLDGAERETLEQVLEACPDDATLLVAESDDLGVVGVAYAHPKTDYFTHETHGYLDIFAVAELVEGKGVGRALIEAVEAWSSARGYRFLTLNVFHANTRARSFYERAGFAPDRMLYYKKSSDA